MRGIVADDVALRIGHGGLVDVCKRCKISRGSKRLVKSEKIYQAPEALWDEGSRGWRARQQPR